MKARVVIYIDTESGEKKIFDNVLINMEYNLNNDLRESPNFLGNLLPSVLYSKGFCVDIKGYVKNPKEKEELEEAIEDNFKNTRR